MSATIFSTPKTGQKWKNKMRITEFERDCLINAIKKIDSDAKIWLFGSRVFDHKKGGDIDIAILSPNIDLFKRIAIKQAIEDEIGEQRIDLLVSKDGSEPFFKMALNTGVILYGYKRIGCSEKQCASSEIKH
jgi:predicted nucleotidyltransferase